MSNKDYLSILTHFINQLSKYIAEKTQDITRISTTICFKKYVIILQNKDTCTQLSIICVGATNAALLIENWSMMIARWNNLNAIYSNSIGGKFNFEMA